MKYVLAPLAGFTDAPFRRMCAEGGADLTYTEMVSAAGLAHGSSPTRHLLETMDGEGPVACQIFGANESDIAYATDFVEKANHRCSTFNLQPSTSFKFTELNLNAGCPMTKVTREGAGAKLVEDPEKIHRFLKAMVERTSLPVTLKTRLGPHPRRTNIFEILDAAESAGAKGIIIHARYTSQMHGGPTHLDILSDVVRRAKIPVTGNGSVVDAKSAAAMAATGVSAIMVGRAALANPCIFSELKMNEVKVAEGEDEVKVKGEGEQWNLSTCSAGQPKQEGNILCSPSPSAFTFSRIDAFRQHLSYLLEFRDILARKFPKDHIPSPDGFASVKMHVHLFRYFNGRPGAAELRKRLNTVRTLAEIETIVRGFAKDAARLGLSPHHAPARANGEDDTTASSTTNQPPITNH